MCVRDGGGLQPSLADRKDTFHMGVQITAIFLDKLRLLFVEINHFNRMCWEKKK